jgi:hypothetical protein
MEMNAMNFVRELVGLSGAKKARGTKSPVVIWKEVKEKVFPVPVIINGRRYWYVDELEAWQRDQPRIRSELTRPPLSKGCYPLMDHCPDPRRNAAIHDNSPKPVHETKKVSKV